MTAISKLGLNLIKGFEGFRGKSYRCPAGVWTIGYGHTSMAGPPAVRAGQIMSRAEADRVLAHNIEKFAAQLRPLITADLTDNQFSALVSFAYNVGVGGFRNSGVRRAVNAEQHKSVPRRLALWVKAGGRTLPGLVKRRSAEAALYMTPDAVTLMGATMFAFPTASELAELDDARDLIDEPVDKSLMGSTTNVAAMIQGAGGVVMGAVYGVKEFLWGVEITPGAYVAIIGAVATAALAYYIITQRLQKAQDYDV